MPHRVSVLTRRADLDNKSFSRHWRTGHADIIMQMPGLVAYAQNHVVAAVSAGEVEFRIDGVVETWFDSTEASQMQQTGPGLFEALLADERSFIEGLTGFQTQGEPSPNSTADWKVWLYVPEAGDFLEQRATALGENLALVVDREVKKRNREIPLMTRTSLRAIDPDPDGIARYSFASEADARDAFAVMDELFAKCGQMPQGSQAILTYGIRVR